MLAPKLRYQRPRPNTLAIVSAVVVSLCAMRYFVYARMTAALQKDQQASRALHDAAHGPEGLRGLRKPPLDLSRLDSLVAAEEARIAAEEARR